MVPFIDAAELRDLLLPLLAKHPDGAVLFDADGTLWAHDVGHIVFDYACQNSLLREEAREALRAEAAQMGIDANAVADLGELGLALSRTFAHGGYDEKAAAEMMVWAYAGFTEQELRSLVRRALTQAEHESGVHRQVAELAAWARAQGASTFIVSASPKLVVEEAASALGFSKDQIAGGVPCEHAGRVAVGMAEPLPYGPNKVTAGRALTGSRPWLLALGDSGFDLQLLGASQIGVGIGEKSALLDGLPQLERAYRLRDP